MAVLVIGAVARLHPLLQLRKRCIGAVSRTSPARRRGRPALSVASYFQIILAADIYKERERERRGRGIFAVSASGRSFGRFSSISPFYSSIIVITRDRDSDDDDDDPERTSLLFCLFRSRSIAEIMIPTTS